MWHADSLLQNIDERGHVVVSDPFPLGNFAHECSINRRGVCSTSCGMIRRGNTSTCQRLKYRHLYFHPTLHPRFVGEDGGHVWK
jgi:hypothetical protein